MANLLGLDLSTRAAAAVCAPAWWDGDWRKVKTLLVGEPLKKGASERERIARCCHLADRIANFAGFHGATHAFIESYAYGQATAAHTLGELGGIVRLRLMQIGVELAVANMSSARKLLCGTIPKSADKKATVKGVLQRAGAPTTITESPDLCDGFVCLNWGMSELGGFCFCQEAA